MVFADRSRLVQFRIFEQHRPSVADLPQATNRRIVEIPGLALPVGGRVAEDFGQSRGMVPTHAKQVPCKLEKCEIAAV